MSSAGGESTPVASRPACEGWLVNLGWLNTTMALSLNVLPFQYLLKNELHLDAEALARFMLFANIPTYLKPLAGILSDAFPLFGTRRRHYAILGFSFAALLWMLLGVVPRAFGSLLTTFVLLNLFLVLVSTVLGGLMVEVGQRENATGKLGSQRQAITQFSGALGGPLGGVLSRLPFQVTASFCALAYASAAPVFWRHLREKGGQKPSGGPLREAGRQLRSVLRSGTLWSAAGMIVLIAAAPGFGTPLFFYQTDVMRFSPEFIGLLGVIGNGCGALAALGYSRIAHRYSLRLLLTASIIIHGLLTLLYLFYATPVTALVITGIEGVSLALAILPLYDLAARATPKGSEALGFCVILSVWNLTTMLSNYSGSWLYSVWKLTFQHLVWINSATTLVVLVAIPFLPAALMKRPDGTEGVH